MNDEERTATSALIDQSQEAKVAMIPSLFRTGTLMKDRKTLLQKASNQSTHDYLYLLKPDNVRFYYKF